jgi:hypothetical protein
MCIQLDLEVRCKRSQKGKDHLIFINFGVKKITVISTEKQKGGKKRAIVKESVHKKKLLKQSTEGFFFFL